MLWNMKTIFNNWSSIALLWWILWFHFCLLMLVVPFVSKIIELSLPSCWKLLVHVNLLIRSMTSNRIWISLLSWCSHWIHASYCVLIVIHLMDLYLWLSFSNHLLWMTTLWISRTKINNILTWISLSLNMTSCWIHLIMHLLLHRN